MSLGQRYRRLGDESADDALDGRTVQRREAVRYAKLIIQLKEGHTWFHGLE